MLIQNSASKHGEMQNSKGKGKEAGRLGWAQRRRLDEERIDNSCLQAPFDGPSAGGWQTLIQGPTVWRTGEINSIQLM